MSAPTSGTKHGLKGRLKKRLRYRCKTLDFMQNMLKHNKELEARMEDYICSVSMIGDFDVPAVNFCGVFFSTKISQMHTLDLIA